MSSTSREQLERWLSEIHVDAGRVLDVGGSQKLVKGRTASWMVDEYKVLDLEVPHKGVKPDIVFDLSEDEYMPYAGQQFDVIFCLEVFEYIIDPRQAIHNLFLMLNHGGTLYISFPFIYPHHEPKGQDFLRYTQWAVEELLGRRGFEIVTLDRRVARSSLSDFYDEERMHMSDNYSDHNVTGFLVKAKKI